MIFSLQDVIALLPELIIVGAACLLLVIDPLFKKCRGLVGVISIVVIIAAAIATCCLLHGDMAGGTFFAGMYKIDAYSAFFKMIFYGATVLVMLMSFQYVKTKDINMGEYYILMLFSLAGMMILASAVDLLTIYVGLELMSIPVYVLAGFRQSSRKSNEGAMKYIILGAFSSGILLYGISFIYGLTGTTELVGIAAALKDPVISMPALSIALVMLIAGFAFKVAGVPFHMWAPDAYEGAPTPITAFMSVGVKAASFAVLLRVFLVGLAPVYDQWVIILIVISVLSMAYGNFVAISQKSLKRMLAYSSIGHAGYAMLGLIAGTPEGVSSVLFYMVVYAFMNIGAFAVIILLSINGKSDRIENYRGLGKTNKLVALLMMIFLFSLAGIPPMAGFMGKFFVFKALLGQGMVPLAIFAVLMSAVAAYFYLRVIMVMYMKEPDGEFQMYKPTCLCFVILLTVVATIWHGVYPTMLIDLARLASGII